MDVIERIPFLTRFFMAIAEDLKIPGDANLKNSEIINEEKVEGGTNG